MVKNLCTHQLMRLHCTVNNTNLEWVVDSLFLNSEAPRLILKLRGILQSGLWTSSEGVTV